MTITTTNPPAALRPEEAAQQLSMSRSRIFELITSGELASFKEGRSRRVPYSAVLEYIDRRVAETRA